MADASSVQQGVSVILTSPVVTVVAALIAVLVGLLPLIGIIWKLFDWAYKLRIEALQERVALRDDRIAVGNEELAKVRQELAQVRSVAPPALKAQIEHAIEGITASIKANTVTITPTGASYMAGTDRSRTPLVLQENPKPPS